MSKDFEAEIDEAGRLILPPEFARQYGLNPGTSVRIENSVNGMHLCQPVTHLAKVYIEPTNRCNLDCVTCMRNSWSEPLGAMSSAAFSRIVEGLRSFSPPPEIFFGGFGEPLSHPNIVDMVRQAKGLGSSVALITNGTLLTKSLSEQLIDAGLGTLWVSLDGATPESYRDVRLGAALPAVLANLAGFQDACRTKYFPGSPGSNRKPGLGIAFVAMKRNISDLAAVIRLAGQLRANHFLVTNLLPYTQEMHDDILYAQALTDSTYTSPGRYSIDLPKMDINPLAREVLYPALHRGFPLTIAGGSVAERNDRCPFVEKGSLSIRWDGEVSPCLALLHDSQSYLHLYERSCRHYAVGNVMRQSIGDLWNTPEYISFRKRVQKFDFSPCTSCTGCDLIESNQEDCFGSPFPTCGGCLWAQGIIRCP
jgi:MoaA/NifB/PqqE/SkfB family radical SAM enzyme